MYIRGDDWRSAHRVAVGCMPTEEIRELYMSQVNTSHQSMLTYSSLGTQAFHEHACVVA